MRPLSNGCRPSGLTVITEFTRFYRIGLRVRKIRSCQASFLLAQNLPPRDLKIHEKRKIKTSIQFKNLSKITSNNSFSRFNNSLKNFGKTWNACHLLYQLSFYKISWRFHQGWAKKTPFKNVSEMSLLCRFCSYLLCCCWLLCRELHPRVDLLLRSIPTFLQNASVLFLKIAPKTRTYHRGKIARIPLSLLSDRSKYSQAFY